MMVTKATSAMLFAPATGDDGPHLNLSGITWDPVMSTGMGARKMMMRTLMSRKKHREPIIDPHRMWTTEGIVDSTWEPFMPMDMMARMAMMQMQMRRKKHPKPMIHQRRMRRTEGIVLDRVKIGQYISDLSNMIMAKQMQWQAMYLNGRLYSNK